MSDGRVRRAKTARWNSDQSESEEEPSSDDSEQEDMEEMPAKASSEHENGPSGQESDERDANEKKTERARQPSRKAGTRAKVCWFLCALSSLTPFPTGKNQQAGKEEGEPREEVMIFFPALPYCSFVQILLMPLCTAF